jgi:hypothetical protein
MSTPKIEKIWLNTRTDDVLELRFDWDNNRHHGIAIEYPSEAKQVADALETALRLINRDPHLR